MRVIKFRAWDGVHMIPFTFDQIDGGGIMVLDSPLSESTSPGWVTVNKMRTMQFTGLKDKNGKELYYDCDLVELEGQSGLWIAVKDDFDIPCFKRTNDSFELIEFSYYFLILTRHRDAFVIHGNIYENPELLK